MDLLHSGRFDGFGFLGQRFHPVGRPYPRARRGRLRIGEHKTPESFRQACRRFIYTENLLAGAAGNLDPVSPARPLLPASAAAPVIEKVLTQMESEDGWVTLREVGTQLANLASDFDPRTYGFRKLSDLVRKTNAFDIEQLKGAPCAFA